jgi:uncharacterized protein (TIGR00251 family)
MAAVPTDLDLVAADGGRAAVLALRVQAGAKRTGLAGTWNRRLKIAVQAPAEDGRANREALACLAELLGLSVRRLELVRGAKNPHKHVLVRASAESVAARLDQVLGRGPRA